MKQILAIIPWPWRIALISGSVLVFGGLFGTGFWKGYQYGHATAEAIGNASIASLQSKHDEAYARALETLNQKIQKEAQSALESGNKLAQAKVDHEKEKSRLQRQIKEITAGSTCVFSSDFVRVWNEAIGAACGNTMPSSDHPAGTDGTPGTCTSTGAGISGKNVSEADVLGHITYYGTRCRNLEAQINAWIDLAEGWK